MWLGVKLHQLYTALGVRLSKGWSCVCLYIWDFILWWRERPQQLSLLPAVLNVTIYLEPVVQCIVIVLLKHVKAALEHNRIGDIIIR